MDFVDWCSKVFDAIVAEDARSANLSILDDKLTETLFGQTFCTPAFEVPTQRRAIGTALQGLYSVGLIELTGAVPGVSLVAKLTPLGRQYAGKHQQLWQSVRESVSRQLGGVGLQPHLQNVLHAVNKLGESSANDHLWLQPVESDALTQELAWTGGRAWLQRAAEELQALGLALFQPSLFEDFNVWPTYAGLVWETRTQDVEEGSRQGGMSKSTHPSDYQWDVFICHASEDKDSVVRPLALELKRLGLRVWYDEFTLRLGDSLAEKIDEGLAQSRFGVVILSRSFFAKNWPKRELNGLASRETIHGRKVILPVWHEIDEECVVRVAPMLADKLAARTTDGIEHVAREIFELLNETDTMSAEQEAEPGGSSGSPSNVTAQTEFSRPPEDSVRFSSEAERQRAVAEFLMTLDELQKEAADNEKLAGHHMPWLQRRWLDKAINSVDDLSLGTRELKSALYQLRDTTDRNTATPARLRQTAEAQGMLRGQYERAVRAARGAISIYERVITGYHLAEQRWNGLRLWKCNFCEHAVLDEGQIREHAASCPRRSRGI